MLFSVNLTVGDVIKELTEGHHHYVVEPKHGFNREVEGLCLHCMLHALVNGL